MLPINGFDITAEYTRHRAHAEAELYRTLKLAGGRSGWTRTRDLIAESLIGGGERLQRFGCWMSSACTKSAESTSTSMQAECS